jgi:hypothetical protein
MKKMLLGAVAALAIATPVFADSGEQSEVRTTHTVSLRWACGNVILRYEMRDGPGWHQSRYTVVNPDAIPYIRDLGPPRFFVEWNSGPRGDLITLNGWPCVQLGPSAER